MIKKKLTKREEHLRSNLSPSQVAKQKAEAVFLQAESVADQRGYVDAAKWAHICGALQNSLADLYEVKE